MPTELPSPIYTISSKRMFDSCPKKYEYRHKLHLDAITLAPALVKGTEFHGDAEQIYSGDVEELSLGGIGYEEWVKDFEEFTPTHVEFPILLPLSALQTYIGDTHATLEGHFAGVVDMVGVGSKDGTTWLLDHKTVSRFYNFPILFSTEQVGMYAVAWKLLGNELPKGVCISRVKLQEAHYKHFMNYALRYLKTTLQMPIGITALRALVRGNPKQPKTKEPIAMKRTTTVALREPRKKGTWELSSITQRNSTGYKETSIRLHKGILVHIEREFYEFSEEELKNIVRDFLGYVRTVQGLEEFRRAPGLHCDRCPFKNICYTQRLLENSYAEKVTLIPEAFNLQVVLPNQEILKALEKRG